MSSQELILCPRFQFITKEASAMIYFKQAISIKRPYGIAKQ
ncbi:hypothetical protein JCM19233_425 [Vibrio astriarenae]|nr:hypothetical protein JCM19233_425 [Vibrio sp. C7]